MPDLGQSEPMLVMTAIGVLLTALGLSTASGLRAYLPLLAVALGTDIPTSDGGTLITLSTPFKQLIGQNSPWVLVALLAVLAVGEFGVDKIPGLDHASDLVHTIVRPVAGAIVMAGISNPLSESNVWAAAALGGMLAFSVHGAKAVTRPVVTATTAGMGNPLVSLFEDVLTLIVIVLSLLAPVLVFIFLVLVAFLIVRGIRGLFQRRRTRHMQQQMRQMQALQRPMATTYSGATYAGSSRYSRSRAPTWPY
jgi:hypothetical protein